MKKLFLLLASMVFTATISAQVSQEEADQIVIDRLSDETGDFTVYAKECEQTAFEVTTATGEILELGYPCWVYYVNFAGATTGKYLIVKESSGNLMEVNAKNDEGPEEMESWRVVGEEEPEYPIDISFEDLSWSGTSCHWIIPYAEEILIINSYEELENYINCTDDIYPEVDFLKNTLILARGVAPCGIQDITKNIQQLSANKYRMNVEILLLGTTVITPWSFTFIIDKIDECSQIELNVTFLNK